MNTDFIVKALSDLLWKPNKGDLVYIRFLTEAEINGIITARKYIKEWKLIGVGDKNEGNWITADRAVLLREEKGEPAVLFVDLNSAGAGMDGIYSAVRELNEDSVFTEAINLIKKSLDKEVRKFTEETLKVAKTLGGKRHKIPSRQVYGFLCSVYEEPSKVCQYVYKLGLWPIAGTTGSSIEYIQQSKLMVEKMFYPPATYQPPTIRIESLALENGDEEAISRLEEILRESNSLTLLEILEKISKEPKLWLGNLKPGFLSKKLKSIEIVPWRNKSNKIQKWSGLKEDQEDSLPKFIIDENSEECALTIKWRVKPTELPSGAATYEIRIIANDEELASHTITHSGKVEQKIKFRPEDFEKLDENKVVECYAEVRAAGGENVEPQKTEDFIICFGKAEEKERISCGKLVRSVIEGVIIAEEKDTVVEMANEIQNGNQGIPDKKGFLSFRFKKTREGFRVERPKLLELIEKQWANQPTCQIGRWIARCRPDGTLAGDPIFKEYKSESIGEETWQNLIQATDRFRKDIPKHGGILAMFYLHEHRIASTFSEYINSWIAAIEEDAPGICLANTLEIQTPSGDSIGLIVLPFHPIRLAWKCTYDTLALHLKYEEKLSLREISEALKWLDGAHFPFILPGLRKDELFIFGDILGFNAVAMVSILDREPRASIGVMSKCYLGNSDQLIPILGIGSGEVLAKEIGHYLDIHSNIKLLNINAIKPGDGLTVVRAIGKALKKEIKEDSDDQSSDEKLRPVSIKLEIFPSENQTSIAGHYLISLTQRRRTGSGSISEDDSWCFNSLELDSGCVIPRLKWARRPPETPKNPAHISIIFDTFHSTVDFLKKEIKKEKIEKPLLAFGLVANIQREFSFENGFPKWKMSIPFELAGEKLSNRSVNDRLIRIHNAIMEACARQFEKPNSLPMLITEPDDEDIAALKNIHKLSDWVITLDRNAGVEYYDSPKEAEEIFDSYVINAVPERDDLGCLQLITSTAHFHEVRYLLDSTLSMMGLSSSARNCKFLLNELKALSGRLAMRMSAGIDNKNIVGSELIALALVRKKCAEANEDDKCWLSLSRGFFVPLDDVRDLIPENDGNMEMNRTRADLLYVFIPKNRRLSFHFVEVKYRRSLAQARSDNLQEEIATQLSITRDKWTKWFLSEKVNSTIKILRAARVARILRFYGDKARRHNLSDEAYDRFIEELERMLKNPDEYYFQDDDVPDRGFVFCPDYTYVEPEYLGDGGNEKCKIWLFGSENLPDKSPYIQFKETTMKKPTPTPPVQPKPTNLPQHTPPTNNGIQLTLDNHQQSIHIRLGVSKIDEPVFWKPSIKSNPHLMIVGQSGMGKTTCLTNICYQLIKMGIAPIIFSYHSDIDEKIQSRYGNIVFIDCKNLGFNPMAIRDPKPRAHVDKAGQLRDIFQGIYPELGDLQLESIRTAIKQSYEELGWSKENVSQEIPQFRRFLGILKKSEKDDSKIQKLLARLNELDDYGFFDAEKGESGFLSSNEPRILRLHEMQSENIQKAFASFILYGIYQEMFSRGPQEKLTHAVIFDEAHRASRLKLLPLMAKECRKYGISLIVASQEARDFDSSLFSNISSYIVLRVVDQDASAIARNITTSDIRNKVVDQLKNLEKYNALFFSEGGKPYSFVKLAPEGTE